MEYVCLLVDLFNREIIGYSTGPYKDARLVYQVITSVQTDLSKIPIVSYRSWK